MIKDFSLVDKFEKEQIRKRMPDFFQNLRIFKSLYKEAMHLGIFPLKDSRDGIEADINLDELVKGPTPSLRGAKRRGNLLNVRLDTRLLRFARNDKWGVFRLFTSPSTLPEP